MRIALDHEDVAWIRARILKSDPTVDWFCENVDTLGLGTLACNCMKAEDLLTIEDVMRCATQNRMNNGLRTIPNVGVKVEGDIFKAIALRLWHRYLADNGKKVAPIKAQ